jgi:IPT/TIG domain
MLAVVVASCADAPIGPRIDHVTPPYGPMLGGTRVTITGAGLTSNGAAPNRVLIAGREAPLVVTVDDSTLEVVIPPGDQPGDAELVLWNHNGNATTTQQFHYSTPPTVSAVNPAEVLYSSTTTRVAVTGSGFLDEDAGDVMVVVDGQVATDVVTNSDTSLTFTAPAGRALASPDIELVDDRGRATRARAFRYTPSERGGLLLFPTFGAFAVFYDPVDNSTVSIPWAVSPTQRFTAVVADDHGEYWATDRAQRFGRIDMNRQELEAPIFTNGRFPTMIRVGADYFALERNTLRFGRFDPDTGGFTAVGTAAIPCCGSFGLAAAGRMYFTSRTAGVVSLNTIDVDTGAIGTPVAITGPVGFHVEEMRFFGGRLYAASRNGSLVTIDPTTGATTALPVTVGRVIAMEVFE